ncbi:MAG TPA: zinc ribbon domain-containing protein [Pyrinomonadaceae bacterium]|nr:zinc ribbon domain-containing protein [Pyrinomonadaceae bacterium]
MYCPHCGTESTPGLNYCNRCGGNLSMLTTNNAAQDLRPVVSTGKVWAAGTTTMLLVLMGLGLLLTGIGELSRSGLPPDVLKTIIFCSMVLLLGGIAFLGWLWTRVLGLPRRSDDAPRMQARSSHTNELGPARASALPEAHINPASSVTEHTTRTLEHVKK